MQEHLDSDLFWPVTVDSVGFLPLCILDPNLLLFKLRPKTTFFDAFFKPNKNLSYLPKSYKAFVKPSFTIDTIDTTY